jgi:hypothetical protein
MVAFCGAGGNGEWLCIDCHHSYPSLRHSRFRGNDEFFCLAPDEIGWPPRNQCVDGNCGAAWGLAAAASLAGHAGIAGAGAIAACHGVFAVIDFAAVARCRTLCSAAIFGADAIS